MFVTIFEVGFSLVYINNNLYLIKEKEEYDIDKPSCIETFTITV